MSRSSTFIQQLYEEMCTFQVFDFFTPYQLFMELGNLVLYSTALVWFPDDGPLRIETGGNIKLPDYDVRSMLPSLTSRMLISLLCWMLTTESIYSKTCLKRNAIVPVFFSVFTGFRFTKGCVLIKQSTKKYDRLGLQWRNNLK